MSAVEKYQTALASPGGWGAGSHSWLMSAANLAIIAGRDPGQAFNEIKAAIDPRTIDREIISAINRAMADHREGGTYSRAYTPKPKPVVKDGKEAFDRVAARGRYTTMEEFVAASPVDIPESPAEQTVLFLSTCYRPDDLLFMGSRLEPGLPGRNIKQVAEWVDWLQSGGAVPEFFIPNPLTGTWAPTKTSDRQSLRGDRNIKSFRFVVVEFDTKTIQEQCLFFSGITLAIQSLTYSGGKSIHGLIDLNDDHIERLDQWDEQVKTEFFFRRMTPMGADGACSNPSRLSRVPGHLRANKQRMQRLIWLAQEGRPICPQVD
jgi:hypothetical protein